MDGMIRPNVTLQRFAAPLRLGVVAAAVAFTAASASAPVTHDVQRASVVNGSFDESWTALIDLFSDRSWEIRNLDKASGIVTTDWMKLGADGDGFADCGSAPLGANAPQVKFNIHVKQDDADVSVTVNATFHQMRHALGSDPDFSFDCNSTKAVERMIQSEISDRVGMQKRKHRKIAPTAALVDAGIDGETAK